MIVAFPCHTNLLSVSDIFRLYSVFNTTSCNNNSGDINQSSDLGLHCLQGFTTYIRLTSYHYLAQPALVNLHYHMI